MINDQPPQLKLPEEESRSMHYLRKMMQSPATTRHTLCMCMMSTFQNAWQQSQKAGQDNLDLDFCDLYPEDIYNIYMFLFSLEQENV